MAQWLEESDEEEEKRRGPRERGRRMRAGSTSDVAEAQALKAGVRKAEVGGDACMVVRRGSRVRISESGHDTDPDADPAVVRVERSDEPVLPLAPALVLVP